MSALTLLLTYFTPFKGSKLFISDCLQLILLEIKLEFHKPGSLGMCQAAFPPHCVLCSRHLGTYTTFVLSHYIYFSLANLLLLRS